MKGLDRESRWIVLSSDGRHVTLGRHSDPTEEEVNAAERSLSAEGLSGWLAVMEGDYYASRGHPSIVMIRPLSAPAKAFQDAVAAFEKFRSRSLDTVKSVTSSQPL